MNKTLIVLVTAASVAFPTVSLAQPVDFSGDIMIKYEKDTSDSSRSVSGVMQTVKLKGTADLGSGWSVYTRIGAQYASQPTLSDFNTAADVYGTNRKFVAALDQFGLAYKQGNMFYKWGRQDASIGLSELLYSRHDENIGKRTFVDGLSATGSVGTVEVAALFGQEDNAGSQDNRIYVFRLGYNPGKTANVGLTLGQYRYDQGDCTNHWAIDGTYTYGKNTFAAQIARSNSSSKNQAYVATWNYAFDDRCSVYVSDFRVEENGDMGKQSDFDNNNKGYYYGINYTMNHADSMEVVYKDQKTMSDGENNAKLEVKYRHAF